MMVCILCGQRINKTWKKNECDFNVQHYREVKE